MQRQDPVGVLAHLLDRLEAVEAPLAGGLDGLPRHALVAVVLRGDRPDHLAREPAGLLPELPLVVVELEIHIGLPRRLTDESIIVLPTIADAAHQLQSAPNCAVFPPCSIALTALLAACSTSDDAVAPAPARREAERRAGGREARLPVERHAQHHPRGRERRRLDAAGVAGALYPATGDSDRPTAVVLVDQDDWATRRRRLGARRAADRRADPALGRRRPARREPRTCSTT